MSGFHTDILQDTFGLKYHLNQVSNAEAQKIYYHLTYPLLSWMSGNQHRKKREEKITLDQSLPCR